MEDEIGITFTATFGKAMTTVDGAWRLTLELSERDGEAVSQLARLKGKALQVAIVPLPTK